MSNKTYFKGVTEISSDDWNDIYMEAYENGLIQDRKDLLPEDAQFSPDMFETIIEDTDDGLYQIVAKVLKNKDVVVLVKPFNKGTT